MEVRELMKPAVITILATKSCYEAALRMRRMSVRHLPVIGEDERLLGVVTDRDLRSFLFSTLARARAETPVAVDDVLREHSVREIMSAPAITVGPREPLASAVQLMADRKIGAIPVVDEGRLVGIMTETDLVHLLFRRRLFCCADVESVLLPVA